MNVTKNAFDHLFEVTSRRPYGFLLEWIDGNVYIVDTNSCTHESIIGEFEQAIFIAFFNNYENQRHFRSTGSPIINVGKKMRCRPDFSLMIDSEYLREEYVNDRKYHYTLFGEIACDEELEHLLYRCLDYMKYTDVDIVLAVNIPIGIVPLSKSNLPKFIEVYCYYRDDYEILVEAYGNRNVEYVPSPIKLYFDKKETFALRVDHLERKIHRDSIQEVTCGKTMLPIKIDMDSMDTFRKEMLE